MHYVQNQPFPRSEYVQLPWVQNFLDNQITADKWPAIEQNLGRYRTPDRDKWPRLTHHPITWLQGTFDEISQRWPAIEQQTRPDRTRPGKQWFTTSTLDVSWIQPSLPVGFDAALWPAIEQATRPDRTRDRDKAPRLTIQQPTWLTGTFNQIAQQFPAVDQVMRSERLRNRKWFSPFYVDTSWIFTNLPATFDPATWPGIYESSLSFRTNDRQKLKLQLLPGPDNAWIFSNLPPAPTPPTCQEIIQNINVDDPICIW